MSFKQLLTIFLALGAVSISASADEPTDGEKLFALKLKTLFASKCLACHGDDPEDIAGAFDMRSREAVLRGGESFEADVLIPGKGDASKLYVVTTRAEEGYEMPPKESEKLTEEQAWWIRDWINEGAPWPDDNRVTEIQNKYAEGVVVPTSGGLNDDWTNRRYQQKHLWAYQPLNVTDVPEGNHPVDWFINQRLQQAQLSPAGNANTIELARRMCFGLTGLPPSPDQVQDFDRRFEAAPSAAVEWFAETLMSSEHYGEHFGRHWLDVARYADSAGFANDYSRPNAWRYRDYVVRSLNSDKPYTDFLREQLAGDELETDNPEHTIATGFLRMGPWEQTGMSVFRITRQQWLDDVTDSVGQTFLAHPLQCAKCHDHKFDPIPTRDYYSMMAVFSTTQFAEPNTRFMDAENQSGFAQAEKWTREKIESYQKQKKELNARVATNRKKETGDAKVGDNGLDPGDEASLARMGKNISRHTWELDKTKPIAFAVYSGKTVSRNNVSTRLLRPQNPWKKGELELDTILTNGDAYSRGEKVGPAALSAAELLGQMEARKFPDGQGRRRLALANWMMDQRNPLTARVMVNRVWSWHFGKGLAGNPNNFGATGKLPTHPKLLDYLADWFMKHDWSVKQLNQLIVTSAAYRRSSRHPNPEEVADKDSAQELYSAFLPRRLTAEELRDSMLAVSGELNLQTGGMPCRPDINLEVAMQPRQIMGGTASVYEPDPLPEQRNRRSIYSEKIRGLRDPFMESFNQPGPDKSCELRETSTVAPQSLTLFNSVEVQDRAIALAADLLNTNDGDAAVIGRLFKRALGRKPSAQEASACVQHWTAATADETGKAYPPQEFSSQITRTVMAEKTGEPYNFIEIMPAYESYVPDLQPGQVNARTRGLAHLCLVVFNLNEFSYLD